MGTLASALAHELNQPLTAVANYCEGARELLAREPGRDVIDAVSEALDEAAQQAVRAGQILRRLRDFISHGEMERQTVNLRKLIGESNALALVGSREHGITARTQLKAHATEAFVDKVQIQQVLVNLIRNSVDSMVSSERRFLTIRTADTGKDMVRLSVEDTGSGISKAVAKQLFKPFVTSKEAGMGVGLSICRTIVEAHGGAIWFEAGRGGEGTVFHITLPTTGECA
jgi:two-component system sensor kinase FixL